MNKVYEYVTEQIIKQLENGVIPWKRPWIGNALNYVSRKSYRGINTFLLSRKGEYLNFNQIKALGGTIKKGAKSEMVVFFKVVDKKTDGAEQGEEKDRYFILRYYKVFHLSDVEGIESKIKEPEQKNPIEEAEKVIQEYNNCPPIKHELVNKAFYNPVLDYINVPPISNFPETEEYYSTMFHEMGHSTGHKKRLGRFEGVENAHFGSDEYSKEELVAEFTASMLCGVAGIEQKTIKNSAAYIQSWLGVLRDDKKILVQAASQAQKAADYIVKIENAGTEGTETSA